ncbi:hypothetical protein BDB00DRAFT_791262 [Zychaea mexicana]|uniref:uncharacterized protein n=1 Tax=Zychaea mexicana TaxID=64656 RepID=UPI0022FDFD91|nr:uncharacterized protein BDB00DRAFT_791262 [Zychaea mexicana]KAI9489253.1 hypothetical protein BDB00DRAFT_791262 [Zychaea mexicana]
MTGSYICKLPQELIDRIARNLTQEDRHACILVCKQWHKVFLPNLYRSVRVRSRQALQSFFITLQKSSSVVPEYPLGWVVRDLTLGHGTKLLPYRATDLRDKNFRIGLSRQRWSALPRLCPYLETLDFHWTTWIEIEENSSNVLFEWRSLRHIAPFHRYDILFKFVDTYGQGLTHLELTRAVVEQMTDGWQLLLNQVPALLHLTLTCAIDFGSLMIGPLTIALDELVPVLPKGLRSLSLTMFNVTMRQQELVGQLLQEHNQHLDLTSRHTHHSLITLDLHMVEFRSPAAITYLGQSFPQLQRLSLGRSVNATLEQEHIDALAMLLRQSQHLKYLALNPIWSMQLLGAVPHASLTELRTGSLSGQIEHQPGTRIPRDAFPKVLAALSSEARALEIAIPPSLVNIDDWIRPLSTACPHLSTLELTGNRDSSYLTPAGHHHHCFSLHTILDALAGSLHSLTLRNATVYLPTRYSTNNNTHDYQWKQRQPRTTTVLKHFGVHQSIIRSDIFDHLASRCPSLNSLSVTDSHYYVMLPRVHLDIEFPDHDLLFVELRSIGVVCEQPEQQKNLGMGMSLALKYKGHYYHAAYHKPSFVRSLVLLDRFPLLTQEEIESYTSLEQLQKDWYKAHRGHRNAYGQNLIPDKSFGYISLQARAVRKCSFESVSLM